MSLTHPVSLAYSDRVMKVILYCVYNPQNHDSIWYQLSITNPNGKQAITWLADEPHFSNPVADATAIATVLGCELQIEGPAKPAIVL